MKTKQRLLSWLLCGAMLLTLGSQSVLAEGSAQDGGETAAPAKQAALALENGVAQPLGAWDISIEDASVKITSDECGDSCPGHVITGTGATTTGTITVESGAHNITLQNVDIDVSAMDGTAAFAIASGAAVNLTLEGVNILKSGKNCAGLQVPVGAELTITAASTGSLTANGGVQAVGIGGTDAKVNGNGHFTGSGGTITINGGTVKAAGGTSAETHYSVYYTCAGIMGGNITISGDADVTADGLCGIYGSDSAGSIVISGGKVKATGTDDGHYCISWGIAANGGLVISGGEVEATGTFGINSIGDTNYIKISGGQLTASSTSSNNNRVLKRGINIDGDLTISDGVVKAEGSCAIFAQSVAVSGGTVTAAGASWGISSTSLAVSGGQLTATGIYGISCGSIAISDGIVTASGTDGYGIGGQSVTISGGIVTAIATGDNSLAGIAASETFTTGTENGNAFILASTIGQVIYSLSEDYPYITVTINEFDTTDWSGVIFQGDTGKIYGDPVTLTADAEIPSGKTLEIEAGKTLIISEDVTLTNNGTISVSGTIINHGTLDNKGTVSGTGGIVNHGNILDTGNGLHVTIHSVGTGWSSDSENHWHPCGAENCTEHQFDKAAHSGGTATCQAQAVCDVCGMPYGEKDSNLHTGGTEIRDAREATASEEGYTGDSYCLGCNEKIADGETVPKLNGGSSSGGSSDSASGGSTDTQEAANPFTDVHKTDWFYDDVMFVYENGFMTGASGTTFSPYSSTTRAQIAVIFYRLAGSPEVTGESPFTDVKREPGTLWYCNAVIWAQQSGIMAGYGDGTFGPNDPVTREQLASIFYRYAQYKGCDVSTAGSLDSFTDKDSISAWAQEAMRWAVGNGMMGGRGNNLLDPKGAAARAEVAAMLHRFLEE